MKLICCHDLGMKDCPFEAKGESALKVKQAMLKHTREAHASTFDKMSVQEKRLLERQMDNLIK